MKILIADDHSIFREGIKSALSNFPIVSHLDEATNGKETLDKIKRNQYDLIILDISMPEINGLDILQRTKDMNIESKIVVMSFHSELHYAKRAIKLGAVGYIPKALSLNEIIAAIRKVSEGGKYVSPSLAENLAFSNDDAMPHQKLSDREYQVMLMMIEGKTLSEIADHLFITSKTVSTYRSRILQKMGMKTNSDIIIYGHKNKLLE